MNATDQHQDLKHFLFPCLQIVFILLQWWVYICGTGLGGQGAGRMVWAPSFPHTPLLPCVDQLLRCTLQAQRKGNFHLIVPKMNISLPCNVLPSNIDVILLYIYQKSLNISSWTNQIRHIQMLRIHLSHMKIESQAYTNSIYTICSSTSNITFLLYNFQAIFPKMKDSLIIPWLQWRVEVLSSLKKNKKQLALQKYSNILIFS